MFATMLKATWQLSALITLYNLPHAQGQTTFDYCSLFGDVFTICEGQTPGFDNLAPATQASCLCGSTLGTLSWGPSLFDGLIAGCATQEAIIDPGLAYTASALEGFCSKEFSAGTTTEANVILTSSTPQTTFSASAASLTVSQSIPTKTSTTTSSATTSSAASTPTTSTKSGNGSANLNSSGVFVALKILMVVFIGMCVM